MTLLKYLLQITLAFNVLATLQPSNRQAGSEFDIIISGGRIVDGTGNPWFVADIGIRDGKIAAIGKLGAYSAGRKIDAAGLIITPGFIDVHTHIESSISRLPAAENFLRMGVTSVVTGNCGSSALDLETWFANIEKAGMSINVASLIGHNTVRRAGMDGDFDRPPTVEELEKMKSFVEKGMLAGAAGFSTGLEYIPGTYGKTDEIVELARVAGLRGGVYATHMRDEGEFVEKSIRESIEIGELAGCPVQISHFKISSKKRWGMSALTSGLVQEARARGIQVTVDQYLYPAGSTGIGILFPSWVFEGGNEKTRERLQDPVTRARIRKEMIDKAERQGFRDFSFAHIANHGADQSYNGKSIAQITLDVRKKRDANSQAEMAIDILLAGGAQMVLHKMSEKDVDSILIQPFTMIASDAGVLSVEGSSIPHPRGFGNNARVLGRYVRERKLLSLEEAVRKMTSLPAQTFRLWDRGLLRPGFAADLVIFDQITISDRATFEEPKQYASGINYVLVNGTVVIDSGVHNGSRPGRVLRLNRQ